MSGGQSPVSTDDDRTIAALDRDFFQSSAMIRLESISNFAQSTWKGLMIVNGGAIVALFTLLGNTTVIVERTGLWWAFLLFSFGLAATLFSNLTAYVTQSAYWQQDMGGAWNAQELMHGRAPKWEKDVRRSASLGQFFEWVALISAVLSLLAFLGGSWCALQAVTPAGSGNASSKAATPTSARTL